MNRYPSALWLFFALLLGPSAMACAQTGTGSPPITATISFRNAPSDVTFSATDPTPKITIVLEIESTSPTDLLTTDGFSSSDFFRRLFFTAPAGGTITNTIEERIHADSPLYQCLSRNGVLQSPALPVAPTEVLPGTGREPQVAHFFRQYVIEDARTGWDLKASGRYSVNARIPFMLFTGGDSTVTFNDCDQFLGTTVANVAALTGRHEFTIESNTLEFVIAGPPSGTMLTALGPAMVWVGLKNSDDVGLKLDLRATVKLNGTVVGTGGLDNVNAGSSGFNNAKLSSIPLTLTSGPVPVSSRDVLSIELTVRNTCAAGGHNSGTARLWFNGAARDTGATRDAGTRFALTIGDAQIVEYLQNGQALSTSAGTSRTSLDVVVGKKCDPFKAFGAWSTTLP